jgi:hypothetical protein
MKYSSAAPPPRIKYHSVSVRPSAPPKTDVSDVVSDVDGVLLVLPLYQFASVVPYRLPSVGEVVLSVG